MGRGSSVERLPQYVSAFTDRHGKRRYRFRKRGVSLYLREHPGTPKHPSAEYKLLLEGRVVANDRRRASPGTVDDLIQRFYGSADFNSAGERTRAKNRAILEDFRRQHGSKSVAGLRFNHVEAILVAKAKINKDEKGRKVGGPFASERLRKLLRRLFAHAVRLEMIAVNPVELAKGPKVPKTRGFHTWTDEEIEQFRAAHPMGNKARLALELLRWTMQRGGDARTFSPSQRKGGQIHIWNEKTDKFTWVPEPPQLTAAINAMPTIGSKTLLVTEYGKPFSEKGFGNWFKKQCVAAGLPHCTAHGVRKATARQLADHAEATQQELKAAGGWSGDREVATYVAEADRKRLANNALGRLAEWDLSNQAPEVRPPSGEDA